MDSRSIAEGAARCRGSCRFLRYKWPPPESGDMSSLLPTSWDSRATGLSRYQHGASPHELEPEVPRGLKARSILCAFDVRSTHPNGSGLQPSIHPGHGTQAAGLGWYGFWPLALKTQDVGDGEDMSPQSRGLSDLADEARPDSSRFLDASRIKASCSVMIPCPYFIGVSPRNSELLAPGLPWTGKKGFRTPSRCHQTSESAGIVRTNTGSSGLTSANWLPVNRCGGSSTSPSD